MPTRIPDVKGILFTPASLIVSRRRSGSLSGDPKCGPPDLHNRFDTFSNIKPCETETLRKRLKSSAPITPALIWGNKLVSVSTRPEISAR